VFLCVYVCLGVFNVCLCVFSVFVCVHVCLCVSVCMFCVHVNLCKFTHACLYCCNFQQKTVPLLDP